MKSLCEFEMDVLRECAGEREKSPWGVAVAAALAALQDAGYIDDDFRVTEAGLRVLRGEDPEVADDVEAPQADWTVELWNAVNDYATACGGDPSQHVYGNAPRMAAVAKVHDLIDAREQVIREDERQRMLQRTAEI